jgi:hypothetical protein
MIILGKLDNCQRVTLRNCTILSSRPYLDHFQITRIESQFLLIGGHHERIKLELDAIIVSFSNLNSFISYIDLFGETFSVLNRSTGRYERDLEIPEICKIRIFSQGSSFSSNNRVLFEIRSLGGKYLHNYLELKSILQDFLNFSTSAEILTDKIEVTNEDQVYVLNYHTPRPTDVKQNKSTLFKPNCKSILYTYSEISFNLESMIMKWFEIYRNLKQVYDLYIGVVYHVDQYDVYRFLMICTALEIYHRLILDGSSDVKEGKRIHYERLSSKIIVTNEIYKADEIQELIRIVNSRSDLSFEERLREIYCKFSEIISKYCKFRDIHDAVKKITDTRNYYTHYNPEKEVNALKGKDLFFLTRDIHFILQLCFLTRLDFIEEEIDLLFLRGMN